MRGSAIRNGISVRHAAWKASASRAARGCATWMVRPRCWIANARQLPLAEAISEKPSCTGSGTRRRGCEA
ncbi:hypothetical protein D3C83_140100 [compost metagenome]